MKAPWLVLAATVAAAAACSGSNGSKLSVSTKVSQSAGVAPTTGGPSAGLQIGTHVTLDRVRVLVRKVTLESADSSGEEGSGGSMGSSSARSPSTADQQAGSGGGGGEDGEGDASEHETDVHAGPFLVDLSGTQLDGGVVLQVDATVPAGTYDELKFQIHKLTPGESVSDPAFVPDGASILLDLTVDGAPVTFTTSLTAVAKIPGPITVADGGTANVTVTIDPSGWFTASDGSFLDPGVGTNQSQIEENIRASIHGFQDDDHDGEADHE
jgi:hypothetical protein